MCFNFNGFGASQRETMQNLYGIMLTRHFFTRNVKKTQKVEICSRPNLSKKTESSDWGETLKKHSLFWSRPDDMSFMLCLAHYFYFPEYVFLLFEGKLTMFIE